MRKTYKPYACLLAVTLSIASYSTSATAQDTEGTEGEDRVLDTVTVTGIQNDAAMAAFQAGDYETAEVEFLDNAMCALRAERNFAASIDSARANTQRADTFENAGTVNTGANTGGGGAGNDQTIQTNVGISTSRVQDDQDTTRDRTCEARGRQLYFAGLSQLQLGKTDEALRSFEKATVASKILYDAHYKIALIKLLSGDTKSAKTQLSKIDGILKRCRRCAEDDKKEISMRRDHIAKALEGQVSLQ